MKYSFILIVATSILSGAIFAKNSANIQQEEKLYCPEKIECDVAGKLDSCRAIGGNLSYWDYMREDGRVEKGTYLFQEASSSYQPSDGSYDDSECNYNFRVNSGIKTISLGVKRGANIEALVDNSISTMWKTSGYSASCGSSHLSCPFTRTSALGFSFDYRNLEPMTSIQVYSHGSAITDPQNIAIFHGKLLNHEQALLACPKDKQCPMDIIVMNDKKISIGNVIVDMENKMQILQITPVPNSGYKITKANGINAIEITKDS